MIFQVLQNRKINNNFATLFAPGGCAAGAAAGAWFFGWGAAVGCMIGEDSIRC